MLLECVNDLMDLINRYHHAGSIQDKLQVLAEAINQMGWGRVHVYVFETETQNIRSAAYCGLNKVEIVFLKNNRMTYESAQLVIGPKYKKYRVGHAYYFPFGKVDEKIEFIRDISSKSIRPVSEFDNWNPRDMLFIPLIDRYGDVIGLASVDDPIDGKAPTEETIEPVCKFIQYILKNLENDDIQAYFDKSRDFLSRLFFVSPAAIFFLDENERIVDLSPSAAKMFEYERLELIGSKSSKLFAKTSDYEAASKSRQSGDKFNTEIQFRCKDAKEFWGFYLTVPVKDEIGEIEGFLSMILNITEARNLQHYLIRAEKMAGIGILASGIAHELNNPLYGVLGLAEAIVEETDLDIIHEYSSDIVRYSKEAAGIIRDLSGYSYSSRSETSSTVDINDTLKKALRMMRRLDKFSNISVITELEEIPEFNASAGELQQVFINMITNAIAAMCNSKRKVLRITTKYKNGFAQVKFTDSGCGISDDNMSSVFEPFYTTKELGKGTGLGLYICYRIALKYQGRIEIDSTINEGTTFTLSFPVKHNE